MHNAEDGTLEEAYESLAATLRVKQDFQRILIDGIGCNPGEHLDHFAHRIVREFTVWRDLAVQYCDEREQQTAKWVEAAAERDRERSSRQAWAAEAMRLEDSVATQRKAARWILSDGLGHACYGRKGAPGECTSLDAHMSGCPDSPWAEREQEPVPPLAVVCACLTDEQAAQQGRGFSRPVCAVHPEGWEQ